MAPSSHASQGLEPPLFPGRFTIRRIEPDLIHVQNHFFVGKGVLAAAHSLGIPIVGTNHFLPETLTVHVPMPRFGLRFMTKYLWDQFASVYGQIDAVTAPTSFAAQLSQHARLVQPVLSISNGVDLERFKPGNDGGYLRERYSIPDRPLLLFVGRLEKEKRLDVVLRAMPAILGRCEAHLVVVEIGTRRRRLARLARELGIAEYVTFTGYVPDEDMPSLYHTAKGFLMAGNAEMQSIATMEAMASGLPVLAAAAGALPELVHDGDNGYLFPDGDSGLLADKAACILRDEALRQRMSEQSLQIIRPHSLETVVTQFEALYQRIVSQKKADSEHSASNASYPSRLPTKRRVWLQTALALVIGICLLAGGSLQPWRPGHFTASVKEALLDDTGVRGAVAKLEHLD